MRAYELTESAVEELKDRLPKLKHHDYDTIDNLMQHVCTRHKITGKKLHDMFVRKYGHTPDTWIKKLKNKLAEQGVAEGHADQQRQIFKKNGKPVGEVGIDRESSPGNDQWYMTCYGVVSYGGYDSYEEAVAELKHCLKQGVAEGSENRCKQCGMVDCPCPGTTCKCKPIAGWEPGKGFKKAMEEAALNEKWSKKYKSSINCSHPKGFSQKAHCAGKKKHNESIDNVMEMTCPDCGMCQTHGDHSKDKLDELKCWSGFHRVAGTKAGFPGSCAKNKTNEESVAEDLRRRGFLGGVGMMAATAAGVGIGLGAASAFDEPIKIDGQYYRKLQSFAVTPERLQKAQLKNTPQGEVYTWAVQDRRHPGSFYYYYFPKEQDVKEETCPHCNGPMFSEMIMNEKKDACYYKVKSRYKVWPSAYASGALVKCRKKGSANWGNGGQKSESMTVEQLEESLHDWFTKEKWVRMDTKGNIKGPCAREPGEGKPKCLPQAKAHNLGKKGRASAAQRKRREDPNPERSGSAINVNTKKKTNEGEVLPLKRPMNKVQHGKRTFPPTQRDVKEPEGNVTPLNQKKSNVSEGVEGPQDVQKIKDFIKWSYKTLNMQKPYPKITISKNTEVAQAGHHTGVHKGDKIWVYVGNRNMIDIFRTLFHELTHHRQMQLNMIKDGDSYPGSPIEMLADMAAGKYIKVYGKNHPEMFQ
jgi:hypothetical protein